MFVLETLFAVLLFMGKKKIYRHAALGVRENILLSTEADSIKKRQRLWHWQSIEKRIISFLL